MFQILSKIEIRHSTCICPPLIIIFYHRTLSAKPANNCHCCCVLLSTAAILRTAYSKVCQSINFPFPTPPSGKPPTPARPGANPAMQSSDLIRNFEAAQAAKARADADLSALLSADVHWLRSQAGPSFPALPALPPVPSAAADRDAENVAPQSSTRASRMKTRSELKAAPPSSRRAQRRAAVKARDRLAQEAIAAAANRKLMERAAGFGDRDSDDDGYATAPNSPLPTDDGKKEESQKEEEPEVQQSSPKATRGRPRKEKKVEKVEETSAASALVPATPLNGRRPRRAAAARATAAMTATAAAPRGRARLVPDAAAAPVPKIPARTTRDGGRKPKAEPVVASPLAEPVPEPVPEPSAALPDDASDVNESDELPTSCSPEKAAVAGDGEIVCAEAGEDAKDEEPSASEGAAADPQSPSPKLRSNRTTRSSARAAKATRTARATRATRATRAANAEPEPVETAETHQSESANEAADEDDSNAHEVPPPTTKRMRKGRPARTKNTKVTPVIKRTTRATKRASIETSTPSAKVASAITSLAPCDGPLDGHSIEEEKPRKRFHRAVVLPWRTEESSESDGGEEEADDVEASSAGQEEADHLDSAAVKVECAVETDALEPLSSVPDAGGDVRPGLVSPTEGEPAAEVEKDQVSVSPEKTRSRDLPVSPSVATGNVESPDAKAVESVARDDGSESDDEPIIRRPRTRRAARAAPVSKPNGKKANGKGKAGTKSKASGKEKEKGTGKAKVPVKPELEGETSLQEPEEAPEQTSPAVVTSSKEGVSAPASEGESSSACDDENSMNPLASSPPVQKDASSPNQGGDSDSKTTGEEEDLPEAPVKLPVLALDVSKARLSDVVSPSKKRNRAVLAEVDPSNNESSSRTLRPKASRKDAVPESPMRKKGKTAVQEANAEESIKASLPDKSPAPAVVSPTDSPKSSGSNPDPERKEKNDTEEMPPPPLPGMSAASAEPEFAMPPPPAKRGGAAMSKPTGIAQTPVLRKGKSAIPRLSAAPPSQSRFRVDGKGKLNMAGIGALNDICSTPLATPNAASQSRLNIPQSGTRPSRLFAATGDIYSSTRKPSHARVRPVLSSATKPTSSALKSSTAALNRTRPTGIRAPIERRVKVDEPPAKGPPAAAEAILPTSRIPIKGRQKGVVSSAVPARVPAEQPTAPDQVTAGPVSSGSAKAPSPSKGVEVEVQPVELAVAHVQVPEPGVALPKSLQASGDTGLATGAAPEAVGADSNRKRPSTDMYKTAPSKTFKRARIAFADDPVLSRDGDTEGQTAASTAEPASSAKEPRTAPLKATRRPRIVTTKSALRSRIEGRRIAADASLENQDDPKSDAKYRAALTPGLEGSISSTPSVGDDLAKLSSSTVAGDSSGPSSGVISTGGTLSSARARIAAASFSEVPSASAESVDGEGKTMPIDDRVEKPMSVEHDDEEKQPASQLGNLMTSISSFLPSFRPRKPDAEEETAEEKAAAAVEVAEADAKRRAAELVKRREATRQAKQKEAEEKQRRVEAKRELMAQADRHREQERRRKEEERARKLVEAEEQRRKQKEDEERRRELKRKRVEEQQKRLAAQEAERRKALEEKERAHRERLKRTKAAAAGAPSVPSGAAHVAQKPGSSSAVQAKPPPPESYEMTASKDAPDADSSDSEAEQARRTKRIPGWARSANLPQSLVGETRDPDSIFEKVNTINLEEVFQGHQQKRRFRTRTSSGMWVRDRLTAKEELDYKKVTTGFGGGLMPPPGPDS